MTAATGSTHQAAGSMGEQYAAEYLKKKGYRILEVNFHVKHPRYGEVDIIAAKGEFLVFVEVKTRRQGSLSAAPWSVSDAQKRRIMAAAQAYLYLYSIKLQPRFDVICLEILPGVGEFRVLSAEHYENAFWMQ